MSLAQRLLLSIALLVLVATGSYGFAVRGAWRAAEQTRFEQSFSAVSHQLSPALREVLEALPEQVRLLCEQSPIVDRALLDLVAGNGEVEAGTRLSLSLLVPMERKSRTLQQLVLFSGSGMVLGASPDQSLVGRKEPRFAQMRPTAGLANVTLGDAPIYSAACVKQRGRYAVGVYAAQDLRQILDRLEATYGLTLSFVPPATSDAVLSEKLSAVGLPEPLYVSRSRTPLHEAMRSLDLAVLLFGVGTLGVALLVAAVVARGLARPIVELAEQAGAVVSGEPRPVDARGGKELEEFATAFNRAISDLVSLRKRLAVTERIAARREVAREVAHEIKNPLAPIRAAIETLRRLRARGDAAFDDYFDEASATVLQEVARITSIVGEFTEFARMPAPRSAPMDLVEAARAVVGLQRNTGVDVVLTGDQTAPLDADRDQLVQVLTNLVQNAVEAVRGQPTALVEVSVTVRDAQSVEFTVADNGPGISPAMRQRLFEAYATDKPGGTGLGLVIVQRIVVEHGGEIDYQTSPSGGALFRVRLPVRGPTLLPEALSET